MDEAVAVKRRYVGPDRVVPQSKNLGNLVDGPTAATEKRQDAALRSLEKPAIPTRYGHNTLSAVLPNTNNGGAT